MSEHVTVVTDLPSTSTLKKFAKRTVVTVIAVGAVAAIVAKVKSNSEVQTDPTATA